MLASDLAPLLRTERFGRALRAFDACGSTNTEAKAWARDGAPEGAVVTAEHQTAGRGRLGRAWADAAGQNLLCSVVLRPDLPPDRLGLVTLAGGRARAPALAGGTGPAACVPFIRGRSNWPVPDGSVPGRPGSAYWPVEPLSWRRPSPASSGRTTCS